MEEWKDVPGYEGRYQVSNQGRVRNAYGKVLKSQLQNSGYLIVHLCVNRVRRVKLVHRLVALAFVAEYFEGAHVNHINNERLANRAENLEWVTRSGNMQHALKAGRMKSKRFGVVGTPVAGGEEVVFKSQMAAEIALSGRASSAIFHCLHGSKKSAYGYTWVRTC